MPLTQKTSLQIARAVALAATLCGFFASPARAEEADEAELSKYHENVDVWHFPVDFSVAYNDQDVIVTRELAPLPLPASCASSDSMWLRARAITLMASSRRFSGARAAKRNGAFTFTREAACSTSCVRC